MYRLCFVGKHHLGITLSVFNTLVTKQHTHLFEIVTGWEGQGCKGSSGGVETDILLDSCCLRNYLQRIAYSRMPLRQMEHEIVILLLGEKQKSRVAEWNHDLILCLLWMSLFPSMPSSKWFWWKSYDFWKKLSIGFCIWCIGDVKPVYRKTKFIC